MSRSQTRTQSYPISLHFATGASGDDEYLIEYNPYHTTEKWLSNRFSDLNTWKAWFGLFVVIIFFVMGGPGRVQEFFDKKPSGDGIIPPDLVGGTDIPSTINSTGQVLNLPQIEGVKQAAEGLGFTSIAVLCFLASFIALAVLYIIYRVTSEPTHLALSENGIAWEWRRTLLNRGSRVAWEDVRSIELSSPEGNTSALNCVINIKTEAKEPVMQIKLGGLATHDDRQALLDSIERWAPDATRDAQLTDLLAAPQDQSYTELWLEALSAPPDRERLEPLSDGTKMQGGKFTVVGHLGTGGQGTAYDAVDADGNAVVLKEFILPVYVDINVRKQALDRMNNEVKLLQNLDHPQIVKLIDFFFEDHRNYLVLEKISGGSLRTMVEKGKRFSQDEVIALSMQMAEILSYLHSLSPPIVHRDFTPDNLMLQEDGLLKLLDFNVAQQKTSSVTCTVVGKQAYLPPEQFRGKPCSQSDIYAMGATMYFLLVGEDPDAITSSHPAKVAEVEEKLDALVAKATALELEKRYQDADSLLEDLKNLAQC